MTRFETPPGAAEPDRLGARPRCRSAQQPRVRARLRADAGLQPARLLPGLRATRRCPSSWTPTSGPSSTSAATPASISTTGRGRCARAPTAGRIVWNPTFKAFADYWGFEPRLCRPYRAQTKGKVESGVKYFKGNFLPGREFVDDVDLARAARRVDDARSPTCASTARPTSARSTASRSEQPRAASHRRPARLPPGGAAGAHRRRRLPGQLRDQPLLGALHADRPDRRGAAPRRPAADLPPRRASVAEHAELPRQAPGPHPARARARGRSPAPRAGSAPRAADAVATPAPASRSAISPSTTRSGGYRDSGPPRDVAPERR